jgi:predicted Zn-dependent peptidase
MPRDGGRHVLAPVPEDPRGAGLCYSILPSPGAYEDTGQITVYAGTSEEEIGDLAGLTMDELKRAADDMTEAEVPAPGRS